MGQYYKPILMGKRYGVQGWLYSHDYDNGLKLMEHSYMGNNFVNAVLRKIDHQPMRVAWMGDYADEPYPEDSDQDREPYQRKLPKAQFKRIWRSVYDGAERKQTARKIHPEPLEGFDGPEDFDGWYLINHTQKAYVDLGKYQRMNGWTEKWRDRYGMMHECWSAIHPLPLLTACGNDRGGGDYHEQYPDYDKVGIWAFDLIEFANYKPVGFTERVVNFTEQIPF
jgi:hypothetical protein